LLVHRHQKRISWPSLANIEIVHNNSKFSLEGLFQSLINGSNGIYAVKQNHRAQSCNKHALQNQTQEQQLVKHCFCLLLCAFRLCCGT